jgi:ribosome biogenesis GTPase
VRDADGKGRHTTTTRDMIALPGGGVLVDTPGVRGVGLWEADDGLGRTFADVEALAAACRFSDCSHAAEPGCAVLAALENGELTHRRLESYRKLLRENAWIASRTDARLRAELRKEWKRRGAQGQADHQRKRGGDAAGEGRRTRR